MSSLQRDMMSRGLPRPMPSSSGGGKKLPLGKSFEPLEWKEFFDEKKTLEIDGDRFNVYLKGTSGPVFYFLHGGGYSGLTWACVACELANRIECRIVAPDLRGHGDTVCANEYDLDTQTQIKDIGHIFSSLSLEGAPVVVVGHSMGGALAVHTVAAGLIDNCVGLVVIDVVEGTAMDALSMMMHVLSSRPSSFPSAEAAIKWCLQSGATRNTKAARISMPSQVRSNEQGQFEWRIDLKRSEPHWVGWFKGLSASFLSCQPPKMLILAGTDRLDKELMIGQMQGKFQTTFLPKVGHAVQEDSPDGLADELARFAIRYKLTTAKGNVTFHPPMC